MRFDGKTVIITGAASGIGQAAAAVFAEGGAHMVLVDVDAAGLRRVASGLGRVMTVAGDVALEQTAARTAKTAQSVGETVHVLLNSAGVDLGASLGETSAEDWDRVLNVNLKSAFLMCRSVVPLMSEPGASIINVSSAAGIAPITGRPAYIASKGGLIALTKALALDLAPSIRVNCIAPGAVETPLLRTSAAYRQSPDVVKARYPLGRIATPREVAEVAAFLASSAAANITGATIPVDGGRSMA